ncbi:hypothetical protein LJC64_02815 [Ruminococcaceae bacterium OttesenSCG-928-A11]|nr:hypothetical protein [Ruminococcaceae bacterium OttesenSCG-928-A11]
MEETKTVQPEAGSTPQEARTFTQEEVNRIVQERLAKERAKSTPQEDPLAERERAIAEREKELEHREFLKEAESKLVERRIPVSTLAVLDTSSPEAFNKALEVMETAMMEYRNNNPLAPPYAEGTGTARMHEPLGDYEDSSIREVMGLLKGD